MVRSALLAVGLAAFALTLVGCGGGSSAQQLSQEEKDKKMEEMKKKNAQNPGAQ
jgi:hypothetical protein